MQISGAPVLSKVRISGEAAAGGGFSTADSARLIYLSEAPRGAPPPSARDAPLSSFNYFFRNLSEATTADYINSLIHFHLTGLRRI